MKRPRGDLCETCGLALEAWPLESPEELKRRHSTMASFRAQFSAVRTGASLGRRADAAEWRRQEVKADRSVGLRCVLRASFVQQGVFKGVEKVTPSDLHLSMLSLRGPDGEVMEGVLAKAGTVPPNVPHFDVECFACTTRVHSDWLLCAEDQHRSEQAAERMTLATRNMGQSSMLTKFAKCLDYDSIRQQARTLQEEQQAAEENLHMANEPREAPKVHVRSRLSDEPEAGMLPPPTAKPKCKTPSNNKSAKAKAPFRPPAGKAPSVANPSTSKRMPWSAAASVVSRDSRPSSRGGSSVFGDDEDILAINSANSGGTDPFLDELLQILGGAQLGRQMRSALA